MKKTNSLLDPKLKQNTGNGGVTSAVPQSPQQKSPASSQRLRRQSSSKSKRNNSSFQIDEQNKPNWKILSTGLQMLFSEEQIKRIWAFDKPKILISEIIQEIIKRLEIQRNFESMERNIISEFHLYNLIFAKQTLFLNDSDSAIFLNLMWTLLINNNHDYGMLQSNYSNVIETSCDKQKTIERDLESFKKWIVKHCTVNPPHCLKIFDSKQVQMIVEYAQKSYFSNFSIFSYCLNNKNKNEEIQINLFVDKPLVIPPLSDALYMGQSNIEIPEDEDEIENMQLLKRRTFNSSSNQMNSGREIGEEYDLEQDSPNKYENDLIELNGFQGQKSKTNSRNEASSQEHQTDEEEIRRFVASRIKPVEDQFSLSLQRRQDDINRQYDDIVNPKKKK